MRIFKNIDSLDESVCELSLDEDEQWLRATWVGYIDSQEAYNGAVDFLDSMNTFHCPYLLNDNSGLRGPWFDSVEWLRTTWAPQAARLGLRYIAHVAQPQDLASQVAVLETESFGGDVQIQIFDRVSEAEEWLREQQHKARL
ncbi:hypothetical protein [Hymenobacter volaticus]|uniref:STAS/SEC14 domain-containing protein n=1 Tax=Hymenobacter volaticus TaxID=2932254 RepID=A0ABY4G988_9BACT|nr:hypothetical protein [Hymenobacter volaticus]UOQ67327.1 hypothetical protein MUN86_05445 [Hymenobacter volaticus]